MNFNYRHKTVTLNTLNSSKISAIVNNIAKQKEDKLKKYLNDQQINNYLTEITKSIKTDVNEHIYRNTIEVLIEQFESTMKPIIK